MGAIHVHEFISLDGVVDAPVWTFDYGFDDKMGEVLGAACDSYDNGVVYLSYRPQA